MGGLDRVWHHARLLLFNQHDCHRCVYVGSSIALGSLHLLAQSVRFQHHHDRVLHPVHDHPRHLPPMALSELVVFCPRCLQAILDHRCPLDYDRRRRRSLLCGEISPCNEAVLGSQKKLDRTGHHLESEHHFSGSAVLGTFLAFGNTTLMGELTFVIERILQFVRCSSPSLEVEQTIC